MPTYDYRCDPCGHTFEALVRGDQAPSCPECESQNLEKLLSLPFVRSETTRNRALRAAGQRDRKQGADRTRERIEYEANHD